MVGHYGQSRSLGLELRKPVNLFAPLGWLAASLLNPGAYFAYMVWGLPEFDMQLWTWHAVAPLQFGIAFALMFLRQGGFGIAAVAFFVTICVIAACALSGPAYALATYYFQQQYISVGTLGDMPIITVQDAVRHAGTHIRLSAFYAAIGVIPAIILLRIIALQRVPDRKAAKAVAVEPLQS
jgi:hypothetical protein